MVLNEHRDHVQRTGMMTCVFVLILSLDFVWPKCRHMIYDLFFENGQQQPFLDIAQ